MLADRTMSRQIQHRITRRLRAIPRRLVIPVLAATLLGAGLAAGATGAAAAVPVISTTPQFDCYSGTIQIDRPSLYENGQSVTWEPEIDVWLNGSWQFSRYGQPETITASAFGQLASYNQTFTARHGLYFKVEDWFHTAANGWQYAQAAAETGGAPINSAICQVA